MSQRLPIPTLAPALKEDGDAVVVWQVDGQVMGEAFNFSALLRNWWHRLRQREHSLKVV